MKIEYRGSLVEVPQSEVIRVLEKNFSNEGETAKKIVKSIYQGLVGKAPDKLLELEIDRAIAEGHEDVEGIIRAVWGEVESIVDDIKVIEEIYQEE